MQPVLFDTSIYTTGLRMGDDAALGLRRIAGGAPVWLSSVVLEELYAGVSGRNRPAVERLERDFHRAGRILVPNLTDWTQTGKVLALLAAKYDYEQIGKGRLTNDALIAISVRFFYSPLKRPELCQLPKIARIGRYHCSSETPFDYFN